MPRISIAMPVYNCEQYVSQSIESLLAQTFGDFEFLISDNASTDGTESICRRYAGKDRRIRYVRRTENIGGPGNFRHVFSLCGGEYVKWSTADDYWHPDFLAKSIAVLDTRPDVVLCYSKSQVVDMSCQRLSDYDDNLHLVNDSPRARFLDLYRLIGLCHAQLGLIRRAAMQRTRLMADFHASDADFLGELALYGKFWVLPEIMFFRRMHPDSSSWKRGDDEHQRRYYDPGHTANWGMNTWKKHRHRLSSVWRAPVAIGDKLKLTTQILRWARYDRVALGRELRARLLPQS